MLRCTVNLQIDERFGDVPDRWLRRVVRASLAGAGVSSSCVVDVTITDDEIMRNLNRTYRGIDDTTDVLSFSLGEQGEEFIVPPGKTKYLGEIIISLPQAQRQAAGQNCSLRRELAVLAAHGTLHLLGYDHEEPGQESRMKEVQDRVLRALGNPA